MTTKVDNLYLVQNRNGTLDTMICGPSMAGMISRATSSGRGGVASVSHISTLVPWDLRSEELYFSGYSQSEN